MNIESNSELDDLLDVEIRDTQIVPYAFEPVQWCDCTNCIEMPTAAECKCCQNTNVVDGKMEGLNCTTQHEGFGVNCLNIHVFETSYYEYVLQNGALRENELIHQVYRYIVYKRFTRWVYGLLGKKNRRIIPSCVVKAIRNSFPSEEYSGFKYPQ